MVLRSIQRITSSLLPKKLEDTQAEESKLNCTDEAHQVISENPMAEKCALI